jgi:hypothetical protein
MNDIIYKDNPQLVICLKTIRQILYPFLNANMLIYTTMHAHRSPVNTHAGGTVRNLDGVGDATTGGFVTGEGHTVF